MLTTFFSMFLLSLVKFSSLIYGKRSKILNTFLFLFFNKLSVIMFGIHKNACQNRKQG